MVFSSLSLCNNCRSVRIHDQELQELKYEVPLSDPPTFSKKPGQLKSLNAIMAEKSG